MDRNPSETNNKGNSSRPKDDGNKNSQNIPVQYPPMTMPVPPPGFTIPPPGYPYYTQTAW